MTLLLTGLLRAMIIIGSIAMILGGAVAGFSGADFVGDELSIEPIVGLVVGGFLGLIAASITFGIIALLFQISDTLEDIRGEDRRRPGPAIPHDAEPRFTREKVIT